MSRAHQALRVPRLVLLAMMFFAFATTTAFSSNGASPAIRTSLWNGHVVTYEMVNGRAVYQGDIILGQLDSAGGLRGPISESSGVAYPSYLWPKVAGVATVYYVIDSQSQDVTNIQAAINQFNSDFTGLIQWVQRTNQTTYVDINLNGAATGQCEAEEGYQPNSAQPQPMDGASNCTVGTILHEMGHVIGLWHEQSRPDRNTFVTVNYQNIIKGSRFNFDIIQDNMQEYTLYDYASVMQYPPFVQTRNGGPSLETIPPGIPLNNSEGVPVIATDYSVADKEGIERLYGSTPTSITVTTNPPGLQILVDGNSCTAPCVENWALNSQHTLEVGTNAQSLAGNIELSNPAVSTTYYYTFGNWNDQGAQSHTITVTPGNGEPGFPTSAPEVSTYTANFIELVPYNAVTFPSTPVPGMVAISPTPQTYPGISGSFLVAREQATLTATVNSGWNFYEFNSAAPYFWLNGGLSENPKTFYVPDTGNPVDLNVEFTQSPVYTVDVEPNPTNADAFSSNLYAYVDGSFWRTPKNFSPDTSLDGSGWNPGTPHTLSVDQYELPYSINTEFAFSIWNQGSTPTTESNSVTLPASSTTYLATMTPAFAPASNWSGTLPCGAATAPSTVASQSAEPNGTYYPAGTNLTFTSQTPVTGWTFAGWTYDLTGTTNPDTLSDVVDESLVFANYNISGTTAPLTLTSLSPATAASGGSGFTLTLQGTGFSSNSLVSVNGTYRTVTFISGTELQVPVTAADLEAPAAVQVFVENFPPGSNGCAVFGSLPFFVSQGAKIANVTATPATLTFSAQAVGTSSASKSVTFKNTGSGGTSLSIAMTGDFTESDNCSGYLSAGASCTAHVTFSPVYAGTIPGAATISDNATNSPQVVGLTGTAIVPLTFAPTKLTFASQSVGTTSSAQTITITNKSSATLNIALAASSNYAISTTTCGSTLGAGLGCTVSITFTPTANGKSSGALTVSDNATDSPQIVGLSGTGSGAATSALAFTPATLSFTGQANGTTSAAKSVTVKNNGKTSVILGSSFPISGNFSVSTNTCSGVTLAPKATCSISVTFSPSIVGTVTGGLTVSDNSAVNEQILGLSGTSVLPITFSPTALTFAKQTVGTTSAAQTVKLTNNLSTTLTVNSIAASGDYSVTNTCGGSVAANGSCTLTVTFTPSKTGSIPGAVTINTTAPDAPQMVKLSGTGE